MTLALDFSGVVDGMDEAEYHRHPALSSSGARDLLPPSTPAKFRYKRDHPESPTRDMELGTCFHTEVLGSGQGYEVVPGDRRTKAVQQAVADVEAAGLIALKPAEAETVRRMAKAVREHPDAGPLLDLSRGVVERALFWTDSATGVQCRALLDYTATNGRYFVDLKSAARAAPKTLPNVINDRKYHIQDAHYMRGARELGLADESTRFLFVFCEKEPPHQVVVAEVHADDRGYADRRCSRAYEMFRDCSAVDIWPGYEPGIHTIRLPHWARREDDEETW